VERYRADLTVDFTHKRLEGFALLSLSVHNATSKLVLDSSSLEIVTIERAAPDASATTLPVESPEQLAFSLGERHRALGRPLTVDLGVVAQPGSTQKIGIHFWVTEASSAVQFLEPAQTAGGKHPYLFTQCQAVHARSLVPCQDTPNVKMTYDAVVTVAAPLTALMSAKCLPPNPPPPPSRFAASLHIPTATFAFAQDIPVPSYLLALAVGDLESRRLGPISRVWAEPSIVEAAAFEFAHVLDFLRAAEALAGEYRWGQYDLLLMPPSFPYGGMENPCLTFVTPTLLTGDRSATNVVAHEIAHSWTGNLVTNATWEHFWLNEGWTVRLGPHARRCEWPIARCMHQSISKLLAASIPLSDAKQTFSK
jgi:leukotriene-A4 hydrolase